MVSRSFVADYAYLTLNMRASGRGLQTIRTDLITNYLSDLIGVF